MEVDGDAMTMPGKAPEDFEPEGPMLARTPALAIGTSVAKYASAELDCA